MNNALRTKLSSLLPKILLRAVLKPLLVVAALLGATAWSADIYWDGGTSGGNSTWATAGNWAGDVLPGIADNAIFDSSNTVTLYTLNSTQQVGSVTAGINRASNFSIRSLSSANGMLVLNGVGGTLLANA